MKSKIFNSLVILILLLANLSTSVFAVQMTGKDILDQMEAFNDSRSVQMEIKLVLYDSAGNKRERRLKNSSIDYEKSKTLSRFLEPADIEGTGFLSIDRENNDEDMYLYLPSLGAVRKISGSQKNGSFVGTDFSYNDLSLVNPKNYIDDYQAELLQETPENYLLSLKPIDEDIDYSYAKLWVNKKTFYPIKVEFYDQQEKLHKVLESFSIKQIKSYWTPDKLVMKDIQKGSKTVLYLEAVVYDEDIKERIFTPRYLKRY
jgi:hypothetical protein